VPIAWGVSERELASCCVISEGRVACHFGGCSRPVSVFEGSYIAHEQGVSKGALEAFEGELERRVFACRSVELS
jgi:hypothetical protein